MFRKVIVMGVSGCGKSLIGQGIAQHFGFRFYDGDDFHPPANIQKMQTGIPLTDEDRLTWLLTLNTLLRDNKNMVLACSALTPAYRAILHEGINDLQFVYLKGNYDLIWSRLRERKDHYFNGQTMLKSQFATLIEPTDNEAIVIDINAPVAQVLATAVDALKQPAALKITAC